MKPSRMIRALGRYGRDTRGLAAAEIVFWLAALVPALFSIVDLGTYVFQRMQVENAAQMGAQTAWARCATPPAGGCAADAAIAAAVDEAVASTSLGAGVTRSAVSEQYFCRSVDDMTLVANGTSTTCSSGGAAGYYVGVSVTYPYTPIIAGISVATLLEGNITETAWTRVR